MTKRCFYEVLGLSQIATEDEIKKSYRRLALKFHPDKAPGDENAHKQFLDIQEAYETLADSQERSWYDNHRDKILNNDTDDFNGQDPSAARINIYRWFRQDCFNGFDETVDSTGTTQCFYSVYRRVFDIIADEEIKRSENIESAGCLEFKEAPSFGSSTTSDLNAFYRFWSHFSTQRNFGFADKWNPRDAPNRSVRRQMEIENKKMRKDARKEFNDSVRALVEFVKKRDPRLVAARLEKLNESKRLAEAKAAENLIREEERAKLRQIAMEDELKRREKIKLEKAAASSAGAGSQVFLDDGNSDSETDSSSYTGKAGGKKKKERNVAYVCEACKKTFKSQAQFQSHEKSKKHVAALAELVQKLNELHLTEKSEEESSIGEREENESEQNDSDRSIEEEREENESEQNDSDRSIEGEREENESEQNDSDRSIEGEKEGTQQEEGDSGEEILDKGQSESDADSDIPTNTCQSKDRRTGQRTSIDMESDSSGSSAFLEMFHQSRRNRTQRRQTKKSRVPESKSDSDECLKVEKGVLGEQNKEEGDKIKGTENKTVNQVSSRKPARKNQKESVANVASEFCCSVCTIVFSSRNLLFKHIKETKHAVPMNDTKTARNKKKKKAL